MQARVEAMIGERFTRLVITGVNTKTYKCGQVRTMAICTCDCGKVKTVHLQSLKLGQTKSCGCLRNEVVSKANKKHGLSNTLLYKVWYSMKSRCYEKTNNNYHNYGGRGITVCDEWVNDFMAFYTWCIANGWAEGLEIDRFPNNDGNYEPDNCRFATPKENCRNKRNNVVLEFEGKRLSVAEWAEIKGVSYDMLMERVQKGWTINEIFNPKKYPTKRIFLKRAIDDDSYLYR